MTSLKNKKILITCGPTCVAIDSMRVLSNRSTGELGQDLAVKLMRKGAHITVLEGPVLKPLLDKNITIRKYFFYDELEKMLNAELKKKYDVLIHAAAVSDYKLAKPFQGKISSRLKQLTLKLVPTKKLINTIKPKAPNTFLVGFKLVDKINCHSEAIGRRISNMKSFAALRMTLDDYLRNTKSDLVVINSLNQNKYEAVIVNHEQMVLDKAQSRKELVNKLINELSVTVT